MQRNTLRNIHGISAKIAFSFIATFWCSTLFTELFLSHQAVANLKQFICYAVFGLILAMMATGITGMKMGKQSQHSKIISKRKRMPIIALIGLLVLLPCAFLLNYWASLGQFDTWFYVVQAVELVAGAINLFLMGKSMKEGLSIRTKKSRAKK